MKARASRVFPNSPTTWPDQDQVRLRLPVIRFIAQYAAMNNGFSR